MSRPLVATIYPSAIAANLRLARERAEGARVLAVIKANAYGHGIARVLQGLKAADGLALLELDAAISLRQAGYTKPILLLEGCFARAEMQEAVAYDLSLVLHQPGQIEWIEHYPPEKLGRPLAVFVKLNSGMNRLGFAPEQAQAIVARLEASRKARVPCLMTHFARADETDGIDGQCARFAQACAALPQDRPTPYPRSLANSGALLRYGALGGDFVRPGIMLYGASPYPPENGNALGLRPAMSLTSEIIAVQNLQPGDCVGYGGLFGASVPMRVATIACGYADGYPRHAPTGTPVMVCGKRTQLVGRVSMDMIAVDLTSVPEACVGSPVELWGENISVDEVARAAGTIGYELLCGVAPRVAARVAENDSDSNGTDH